MTALKIALLALVVGLTGCAQLGGALSTGLIAKDAALDRGGDALDAVIDSKIDTLCRAISVGSALRKFGRTPGEWVLYCNMCDSFREFPGACALPGEPQVPPMSPLNSPQ